jgi:hypothetical protein
LSSTNPTWTDVGAYPNIRGERLETNRSLASARGQGNGKEMRIGGKLQQRALLSVVRGEVVAE